MKFTIDPGSGYAESYLDVKFTAEFKPAPLTTLEIHNITTGEILEIVSISSGVITDQTKAIFKGSKSVEGYINLFNRDKMNERLRSIPFVDLKAVSTQTLDDQTDIQEETTVRFYNESMSLDCSIIPFDLIIQNADLDLYEPLLIQLVSDIEKKYELAVMSADRTDVCTFEVLAKKGRTQVRIPSEIIWSDTDIHKKGSKELQIYWVKFEGIDQRRFRNRKYIPIDGAVIRFKSLVASPRPQLRIGPTGVDLPDDFVLSDRYNVHTWRNFTSLGDLPFMHNHDKQVHISMFMHEYQSLQIENGVKVMSDNIQDARRVLRRNVVPKLDGRAPLQTMLIGSFASVYDKKSQLFNSSFLNQHSSEDVSSGARSNLHSHKPGGCGCSRKS